MDQCEELIIETQDLIVTLKSLDLYLKMWAYSKIGD